MLLNIMKSILVLIPLFFFISFQADAQQTDPDHIETENGTLTVQPIQHGTLVLSWNKITVYIDPTGGTEAFEGQENPDLILITHNHGDHMDIETLSALDTDNATIIAPQSVADKLPASLSKKVKVLSNGEKTGEKQITVRAIPMYNLPDDSDSRHPKGWGNGYVLGMGGKNIYISGDTEDIPEMRSLENIDVAFVCMNLPYTMDINQAASAVLDFEPEIVYPYHYRGQDTEAFKNLVNDENKEIEVRLKNWYADN